jgi:hypothetical protein
MEAGVRRHMVQRKSGENDGLEGNQAEAPERPIMIERAEFYASLHSPAAQALLADARQLIDSRQFPPTNPGEL